MGSKFIKNDDSIPYPLKIGGLMLVLRVARIAKIRGSLGIEFWPIYTSWMRNVMESDGMPFPTVQKYNIE